MHIPRVNSQLIPAVRDLCRELPWGYVHFLDIHSQFDTLGSNVFDRDIHEDNIPLMVSKIQDFTAAVRLFKWHEKQREREAARSTLSAIFESLTGRDGDCRAALLTALDPLCIRLTDGESFSFRGEIAPDFDSFTSGEITAALLRYGDRSKIVKIAKSLRRDILRVSKDCPLGVSFSLKRIDRFIDKFNPSPQQPAEEKQEEQHGLSESEVIQSI